MEKRKSILKDKSYIFAVEIVRLSQYMQEKKEYILNRQLLKSGTSF